MVSSDRIVTWKFAWVGVLHSFGGLCLKYNDLLTGSTLFTVKERFSSSSDSSEFDGILLADMFEKYVLSALNWLLFKNSSTSVSLSQFGILVT